MEETSTRETATTEVQCRSYRPTTSVHNSWTRSVDQGEDIKLSHLEVGDPVPSNTSTLLHSAAVNGNKRALQKLIQKVGNASDEINRGDQFGRTPLVYSVLGDRLDCAKLLILNGASVSMGDFDGRTALHWAAYQGSQKCVKLLLARGADWKAKDAKGRTPLHFAASNQSTKCLSVLLKRAAKGDAQVDDPDNDSMTALHWGASYGNTEHVRMLLKAKASVKLQDLERKTPLHWATTNRDASVVKLILNQTTEIIDWQDVEGRTALHLAVAKQNEEVVKSLLVVEKCHVSLQDNMGRTPLHWATVLENPRIVKLLLRKGADYTLVDGNGSTVLHYAAQGDFAQAVKVLLSSCDIQDSCDEKGRTALMWAAGKGASSALKTMLDHDFDVHKKDNLGRTALHIAAYTGDIKCVEMLLKYGASVNAFDHFKHTPLFRACEMGYADVVQLLRQNDALLDLQDQDGRTPLHWAALNGHVHICLILVRDGVPVNSGDKLGCTPLHCAAYGGFVNCMSLLIDNGADVNKLDNEGSSAFHWCCSSGHLEAVKLLFKRRAFPNYTKLNEERLTPLDLAIIGDHQDVAQYMIEQGGLTLRAIKDVAATTIQSCWRGYRVRKPFQKRKTLYMRHEQLKRDMKRRNSSAKEEEIKSHILEPATSPNVSGLITESGEPGTVTGVGHSYDSCRGTADDIVQLDVSTEPERISTDYHNDGDVVNSGVEETDEENVYLPTILEGTFPSLNDGISEAVSVNNGLNSEDMEVYPGIILENGKEKCDQDTEYIQEMVIDTAKEYPSSVSNTNSSSSLTCRSSNKPTIVASVGQNKSCNDNSSLSSGIHSILKFDNKRLIHENARKERKRRELIRSKIQAATTIQRWYRGYRKEKQYENNITELQNDQEELVKQIAALTIQLWWRKYLCREYDHGNDHHGSSHHGNDHHGSSHHGNGIVPLPVQCDKSLRLSDSNRGEKYKPPKPFRTKAKDSVSSRAVVVETWARPKSRNRCFSAVPSMNRKRISSINTAASKRKTARASVLSIGRINNKIRPNAGRTAKPGFALQGKPKDDSIKW